LSKKEDLDISFFVKQNHFSNDFELYFPLKIPQSTTFSTELDLSGNSAKPAAAERRRLTVTQRKNLTAHMRRSTTSLLREP